MSIPTTPSYSGNIAALSDSQPDLASAVTAAPIPGEVTEATGRDGSATYLLPGERGRRIWFGGSSMPTVSAEALFADFQHDGRNAVLPAVLTGREIRVLADRLPPFCALFVAEEDLVAIKLAMHLHDYRDLIAAKRLLFLRAGNIADDLRALFEAHPGLELPKHMLTVPHHSAAQMNTLQRHLENAGADVVRIQASVVASCVRRCEGRTFGPLPQRPHLAVLSVDPRPGTIEQVHRIERALVRLGWPHEVCMADAPDHAHIAARLQAIDRAGADGVLLVNCGAGHLSSLLPQGLAMASWLTAESAFDRPSSDKPARYYPVFAASGSLADALAQAGVAADAIVPCEVGADDGLVRTDDATTPKQPSTETSVAVLMNLPDDRMEAINLTLPSHRALWRAMQAVCVEDVDRFPDTPADQLLERAQTQSGTTLEDDDIGRQFALLLRTRIAPACLGRTAVEALISAGRNVSVCGSNWPPQLRTKDLWSGPIPVGEALGGLLGAAEMIVLPALTVDALQIALDALAVGTPVVCRAAPESVGREHSGLQDVIPYLHFYQTRRELTDTVDRLLSDPPGLADRVRAGRKLVRAKHMMSQRVLAMADKMRRLAAF